MNHKKLIINLMLGDSSLFEETMSEIMTSKAQKNISELSMSIAEELLAEKTEGHNQMIDQALSNKQVFDYPIPQAKEPTKAPIKRKAPKSPLPSKKDDKYYYDDIGDFNVDDGYSEFGAAYDYNKAAMKANKVGTWVDESKKKSKKPVTKKSRGLGDFDDKGNGDFGIQSEDHLNELSPQTVHSYLTKAAAEIKGGKDAEYKKMNDARAARKGKGKNDEYEASVNNYFGKVRSIHKRNVGIGSAVRGYVRNNKVMPRKMAASISEDVQPLSELSNQLLDRFIKRKSEQYKANFDNTVAERNPQIKAQHRENAQKNLISIGKAGAAQGRNDAREIIKNAQSRAYNREERLDELSKQTLASYAKKASEDARMKMYNAGKKMRSADNEEWKSGAKDWNKADKRQIGVERAVNKMVRENKRLSVGNTLGNEVKLDETHLGFDKLKNKLAHKGVDDPAALAAWIGRKKYGAKKFQKAAETGKAIKEDTVVTEHIKGWKNALTDIAKHRANQANANKSTVLVRLNKNGSESKMHDAKYNFSSPEEAVKAHEYRKSVNPGKQIHHNMYVDGKLHSKLT